MGISVIIGTYNSARHLPRVLESVKNFDEVVVCDMESTDNTVDIVKQYGASVVHVAPLERDGHQKIRDVALNHAASTWVLVLRPDEIVTPQLRKYLYEFAENPGDYKGLIIPRKNYVLNRLRDDNYPDYQLRFFDRRSTTWKTNIEADPKVDGKVKKIPAPRGELALIKLPRSLSSLLNILNERSTAESELFAKDQKITTWKMIRIPFGRFFKEYFVKGKIKFGTEGYVTAVNKALRYYCAMAKAHEDKAMKEFYEFIDDIIAERATPIIPEVKVQGAHASEEADDHHGYNDYHLHSEDHHRDNE